MKKKVVRLTEEDLVRIIKKVVSEQQKNDDFDVSDQIGELEKMKTVQQSLSEFLPILNKTESELKDIQKEELVNQVMNTNMTNSSMIENMGGFWRSTVKGTGYEDQYRKPFQMVQNMIKTQKIDGNYLPIKWLRDVLLLSKSEFQDFIKDVKNLEGLLDKHGVDKDKNDLLKITRLGSRVPPDLRYRVRIVTGKLRLT